MDNSFGEESATNNKFDEESITNDKIEEESVRRERIVVDAVKKTVQRVSAHPEDQSGDQTVTASVQTISSDAETVEYKNLSVVV